MLGLSPHLDAAKVYFSFNINININSILISILIEVRSGSSYDCVFYVFPFHVFTLPSSCVSPRLGVDPPNSGTDFLLVPYTCNQDTNKKIGDFNQTFKKAHNVLFQN